MQPTDANSLQDSTLADSAPATEHTPAVDVPYTEAKPAVSFKTPFTCKPTSTYRDFPGNTKAEQISNMRRAIAKDIPRRSNGRKYFTKVKAQPVQRTEKIEQGKNEILRKFDRLFGEEPSNKWMDRLRKLGKKG